MSATEDESQNLDAGWDDEEPSAPSSTREEDDIDEAWDSLPPPVSGFPVSTSSASSMPPATEAVDSGWDDLPEGAPGPAGKRRPHRQRRAKSNAVVTSASPVLMPRPAEPSKKQHREHARKQRAYEAQVKQQRKQEKKTQRAVELRKDAEARAQQAEAEQQARQLRREAREASEREERARRKAQHAAKASRAKPNRAVDVKPEPPQAKASAAKLEASAESPLARASSSQRNWLRPGVIGTLLLLAAVVFLLVTR
jgi:hypothetical protein